MADPEGVALMPVAEEPSDGNEAEEQEPQESMSQQTDDDDDGTETAPYDSSEQESDVLAGPSDQQRRPSGLSAADQTEQHRKNGNDFFAREKFDKAIVEYTAALKLVTDPEIEATLLSNRSAALSSWCKYLRTRPAHDSERHALFGHDPFHLASLALRDAKKAIALKPAWWKAHSRKGMAHYMLEQYAEAEASYLEAASLEPSNQSVAAALKEVHQLLAAEPDADAAPGAGGIAAPAGISPRKRARSVAEKLDDFECTLCMKLLYEPVTTPCGHTYCQMCFHRAMDHSNRCPMCRTVLHAGLEPSVTITLKNIISHSFPAEYEERRQEIAAVAGAAGDTQRLPLFVMSSLFPGESMSLNIFEPRYRLLVRRCMEGNRRFGMATVSGSGQIDDVAAEVEIQECQTLPDGRFYLEVVGKRRVRLSDFTEQDGYRVARMKPLVDVPPPVGSEQAAQLAITSAAVVELGEAWLARLRAHRLPLRVLEALERLGSRPPADKHEDISFWAARLMVNSIPQFDRCRHRFMSMTSTQERLSSELDMMTRHMNGGDSCAVM